MSKPSKQMSAAIGIQKGINKVLGVGKKSKTAKPKVGSKTRKRTS
jgi:hypothetical protein